MAFKVTGANVDLVVGTATLVATDLSSVQTPISVIQVQFPFQPNGTDEERVIAEAKKVLQQAIDEL
jgi:hypothetical protein